MNLPIVCEVVSSICFNTSFVAASTKSCSISMSSGSTTSSFITTSVMTRLPVAFTVTIPPPAVPVNS
ncbi:hypothetical protein SAMD00023518_01115 [Listeria monocytogenes]|nr:hypothetical protein SAMD00023518_01115 [Listeria monocytogenes]